MARSDAPKGQPKPMANVPDRSGDVSRERDSMPLQSTMSQHERTPETSASQRDLHGAEGAQSPYPNRVGTVPVQPAPVHYDNAAAYEGEDPDLGYYEDDDDQMYNFKVAAPHQFHDNKMLDIGELVPMSFKQVDHARHHGQCWSWAEEDVTEAEAREKESPTASEPVANEPQQSLRE